MKAFKFSAWMLENGKEVLWLTYSFQAVSDTEALFTASEYIGFRRCTNEIVRMEVKRVNYLPVI